MQTCKIKLKENYFKHTRNHWDLLNFMASAKTPIILTIERVAVTRQDTSLIASQEKEVTSDVIQLANRFGLRIIDSYLRTTHDQFDLVFKFSAI